MKSLSNYNTILWDFDGVIMDSMPIRDLGFKLVLSDFPEDQVNQLMNYHRNNGGLSRYHKFRYFYDEIRKESISEKQIEIIADQFSEVMLKNLLNPKLLIQDSVAFIQKNYLKYNMHIVSGSDQKELRIICEHLGLSVYFKSIHGSPIPKQELVKNILGENKYKKHYTCLIGDSINDFEAAHKNSIDFFGFNNNSLKLLGNYISQFDI